MAGFVPADVPLSIEWLDERAIAAVGVPMVVVLLLLSGLAATRIQAVANDPSIHQRVVAAKLGGRHTGSGLLSLQVALCLVLVFVAALFGRSLQRVKGLDLGIDPSRTVQVTVNLRPAGSEPPQVSQYYQSAHNLLAKHPGVDRVALAEGSPYMAGNAATPWTDTRSMIDLWQSGQETAYVTAVGAGFFGTVGARLSAGRDIAAEDSPGAQRVAIINAPLAKFLWPIEEALGKCIYMTEAPGCIRVVGVLAGVWKFNALNRDKLALYVPLAQTPAASPGILYLRPKGSAAVVASEARKTLQLANPHLPPVNATVVSELLEDDFRPWRLGATVFGLFATLALIIGSVGLFVLTSFAVVRRRREIGIRLSLGATRREIVRLVAATLGRALALGIALGCLAGFLIARSLRGALFETSGADPMVLFSTAALLGLSAASALVIPTMNALHTDPTEVLKGE